YLYHVVDNQWSMAEYGSQAVVWQTAVNPVVALELLATGAWSGTGVLGPEAFPARPFLDLLTEYGSPWGLREQCGIPRGPLFRPVSTGDPRRSKASEGCASTPIAGDIRWTTGDITRPAGPRTPTSSSRSVRPARPCCRRSRPSRCAGAAPSGNSASNGRW